MGVPVRITRRLTSSPVSAWNVRDSDESKVSAIALNTLGNMLTCVLQAMSLIT
jgi:hypothetical protein